MKRSRQQLLILIFLSSLFLNACKSRKQYLPDVKKSLVHVQNVVKVDADRQFKIDKVIQIINKHNFDMGIDLKQSIANEIYNMSIKYPNLDIELICATITHESARTWDPTVVSNAGAMGLMQIMPATGRWLSQYEDFEWLSPQETLFNPIQNIRLGARYLSALIETYDLDGGLAAYNGGSKRVNMWLSENKRDDILWPETRKYVPTVLKLYDEFRADLQ